MYTALLQMQTDNPEQVTATSVTHQGFFLVQFGAEFQTCPWSHQPSILPNFQANFPKNLV